MRNLPICGRTIVVPESEENLLCLKQLVRSAGFFVGNESTFIVYRKDGSELLKATDRGDGFCRCSYKDLKRDHVEAYMQKHFSAEERERASRARELCTLTGHPGFEALILALDSGCFSHTDLTGQDVRNAREIFGPCTACLEGKMREPSHQPSQTPPATEIGEHLHSDLIPLQSTSLGGNNYILIAVDEKTGYVSAVPIKKQDF